MNAYTERIIGPFRREALDHFLLFSNKQVENIIKEYVENYNHFRPYQGIDNIPDKNFLSDIGRIKKKQVLGESHHHY